MNPPALAVIPSLLIVPPLALLGLLLPTIFDGWVSTLRRWRVLLLIATLNCRLYGVHFVVRDEKKEWWWATPATLWVTLTLLAAAGVIWARQRRWAVPPADPASDPKPQLNEHVVLGLISAAGLW